MRRSGYVAKKAPKAPDPYKTAAAQTQLNKDTALYNAGLNRIDQRTPYGSSTYKYNGVGADGVPNYSQDISLTALGQQNLDNQQQQDAYLSQLGFGLADQAKTSLAQPMGNSDDARKQAQDAYYAKQTGYLDPRFANEQHDLETQLSNQGVQQNSEAWNRAKDEFGRNKTFAYDQAQTGAIGAGTDAQAKAQALALQLRQTPLNELNALRSGTQVTNPNIAAAGQSNAQTADLQGAIQSNYQNQLASYNNSVSGFASVLGAGLGAAGTAFKLSDRRLKRNIEHVGATAAGVPVYVFSYLWDTIRHVGVMAQDVLKVAPEAVVMTPSGFYAVRYDMVP
jgi:hypothetical protein